MGKVINAVNRFKPVLHVPGKTVINHDAYTVSYDDGNEIHSITVPANSWTMYELRQPTDAPKISPAKMAEMLDKFFGFTKKEE